MKHFVVIFFLLSIVIFISCDRQRVYENYHKIENPGWHKDSVAAFNFSIGDTSINHNIVIYLRNLENYPYSNLWLFIEIIAPDLTALNDTAEFRLAHANGKWIGKGSAGNYLNEFKYRSNVYFPLPGEYTFNIKHGMRNEKLPALNNVGLRIEKR